ncbi:MAG: hypothetical protein J5787_08160 [Alphaproteobacteria bacterium]|nr:hypothetical protein [Alphaproteobacteria bacterium]MBO4644845.1 hypothetical protein [Alphaproteobacteria bacterium]
MNNNTESVPLKEEMAQDLINKIIDEETVGEFQTLASDLALSEEQAQGIWNWLVQGAMSFVEDLNRDAAEYCSETEEYLRGVYGNSLEARKKAANDLILKYGGDELVAFLKKSGIGNCREILSFLMNLADAASEDRGLIGEKASVLSSEEKIKAEIARLMAEPAYMQARHPEHDATVQQVYRLRKHLFGEE